MNMMSDYRAISDTACDTQTSEMPTMGALTLNTLDMQAETLAMICNIVSTMWGDDDIAAPVKPNENLVARLAAIQVNQGIILNAVKDIADKL